MSKKCGVNKNLFKKYDFKDHTWAANGLTDLLHLAKRCVKIDSTYWFKKVGGEHWIPIKSIVDAEKEAVNTWLGGTLPSGKIIDQDLIATFFSGIQWLLPVSSKAKAISDKIGSCPNISQKMVIPMGSPFITYKGQSYLNTWYDDMVNGDEKNIRIGKMILLMCYGSLCNGTVDITKPKEEADRVYEMVLNNNYDNLEFKFLINWIAAIVQNPGINLQTNLWLIGEIEGLGKGTIVDIMRIILGSEFVGELNQTELEAGWNDHLVGLQLVEINEFDAKGKWSGMAWGKWIKGHTIEPTLKIRERNKTSYTVLNIGNYIGTSNVIEQTFIDSNDRRNMFIQTTSNNWWVEYATDVQIKYFKVDPISVASGFAYILEQVKVDFDFIKKSHRTAFRNSIAANNTSNVEQWYDSDPGITRGTWQNSRDLYEEFKKWFKTANPSESIPSETIWGKQMLKARELGVKKQRAKTGVQYIFDTPVEHIEHKLSDVDLEISKITLNDEKMVTYDLDEKIEKVDLSIMTPIEKMRILLQQRGDD